MEIPIEIPLLLSTYDSKLSLLLNISQTRFGAVHVMNAGLFSAVRTSRLFSVDPDIGIGMLLDICLVAKADSLEIDNPDALTNYYKLLLSVIRVIASVVVSRGSQNEQTIDQARLFLSENRPTIVAIFKRQSKIGAKLFINMGTIVDELVELFTLMITMTGFLEVR